MDELVSVIIPAYNHEKYIYDCLESVINQTYKNLEIIVEDDCSTDNTIKEIKRIKDKRIKCFFSKKNKGVVETINNLLKKCNGKYIAIIGSDDVWYPNKIAEQVKVLKKNPKIGAVFTDVDIIDEGGIIYNKNKDFDSTVFKVTNVSKAERYKMFYIYGNHLCHPSSMVTKELTEDIGMYNKAYRQLHDYDYWVRALDKYDIYIINKKLMGYRRERNNNKSVSATNDKNIIRTFHELFSINSKMIINMKDKILIEGFKELFKNPNSVTKEELICEKYFLLLEMSYGSNNNTYAYSLIFNHQNSNKLLSILEKKYNYTVNDFYEATGIKNTLYPDKVTYREYLELIEEKNNEILKLGLELENMINSTSWKITKPIRKIGRFKKNEK